MQPPIHTNDDFINGLKQTEVRWLANAIFAPPLLQMRSLPTTGAHTIAPGPDFNHNDHLHPAIFQLDNHYQQWLQTLDKSPQPLLDFLRSPRRMKLGILHERLWQFFLANQSNTQLLATNLKARQNNRDIGEFDIVYRHKNHGLIHLEVASKYYLASSISTEQWPVWLGPGKTDRLDLKLEHSINKQINLADYSGVKEQLIAQLQTEEDSFVEEHGFAMGKQLHIGGRLFYRYSLASVIDALSSANDLFQRRMAPLNLNPHHLCGHWLFDSEWKKLKNTLVMHYQWLEKPQWLDTAKHNLKPENQTLTTQTAPTSVTANTSDKLQHNQTPRLLVYNTQQQQHYFCFIVPDNWADNL